MDTTLTLMTKERQSESAGAKETCATSKVYSEPTCKNGHQIMKRCQEYLQQSADRRDQPRYQRTIDTNGRSGPAPQQDFTREEKFDSMTTLKTEVARYFGERGLGFKLPVNHKKQLKVYGGFEEHEGERRDEMAKTGAIYAKWIGTAAILSRVAHGGADDDYEIVLLEYVLYSPGSRNLYSPSRAIPEGVGLDLDKQRQALQMKRNGFALIDSPLGKDDDSIRFIVFNEFLNVQAPRCEIRTLFMKADGAADIATRHQRPGHHCNQYVKTMVDKCTVRGMHLTTRSSGDCAMCHLSKQRRKLHAMQHERAETRPN
ncbi:hypothetical protein PybrP1_002944 [[Pythium] brassicae (nom. inval.)]|nr:hypothetical protein PybrP1_002944 [[Pythium] brassicae (nom. inval.)]